MGEIIHVEAGETPEQARERRLDQAHKERRCMIVPIATHFLVRMLQVGHQVKVVGNGLPEETRVIAVFHDPYRMGGSNIMLQVISPEFEPVDIAVPLPVHDGNIMVQDIRGDGLHLPDMARRDIAG